jgi:hypothetical protein
MDGASSARGCLCLRHMAWSLDTKPTFFFVAGQLSWATPSPTTLYSSIVAPPDTLHHPPVDLKFVVHEDARYQKVSRGPRVYT